MRPRVHLHLNHGRSLDSWRSAYESGAVFEPSPYGYLAAERYVELTWSVDHAESPVVRLLRRGIAFLLGFDLVHAWRNRGAIAAAEVVWTHTEKEYLAIALLERLGRVPHRPMIAQSVWLWDRWRKAGPVRRALYRRLLARVEVTTVHSPLNAELGTRALGRAVRLVPYGVGPLAVLPAPKRTPGASLRVLAVGHDIDRDWESLAAVADARPDWRILVLSRRRSAARLATPERPNLTVRPASGVAELLEAYTDCDVVAVPLRDNVHVSGMTATLEAVVQGRPLAATDTGGLRELLGEHAAWARVGDPASLADAIADAASRGPEAVAAARDHVRDAGLTLDDFVHRHVLLTAELLGVPRPDDASRTDRPEASAIARVVDVDPGWAAAGFPG